MTATVLTSENILEFQLERIPGPKAEAKPDEVKVETKTEPKPEVKAEKPAEKEDGPLQRRFSELARERKDAEAKADRERERADKAERELAEARGAPRAEPEEDDLGIGPKPDPKQYADVTKYAEALAGWSAKKAVATDRVERDLAEQKAKVDEERGKVVESWKGRVETFKATTPDYDEMLASSKVTVHNAIRDAIIESEVGPQILYALAKDDELAAKFSTSGAKDGAAVSRQLRALGRLEASFEKPSEPEAKKEPKEIKRAPDPITPVKGGARSDGPPGGSSNIITDVSAYKAWREQRRTH